MRLREAFLAVGLVLVASPALACGVELDTYSARLGNADHFNSNGTRLRSAAAILRQDRANFHKFGIKDPEDEWDSYFSKKSNRARMESLLKRGTFEPGARNAIVNNTPFVFVRICGSPAAVFVSVSN